MKITLTRFIESQFQKPKLGFLFFLFCKLFFKFYCPLYVKGRANLPPPPFIICSNHCSHMDTPALMLATTIAFNRIGIVAARDYFFELKKRRVAVKLFMNIIPITRKCTRQSIFSDIERCKIFIQKTNGCLIIYPEGSRSIDGAIQPFKRGVALISNELGLPIIPVYIQGTHKAMGKWAIFPKPGKINLVIGEALQQLEIPNDQHMINLLENKVSGLKAEMLEF